MSEQTARNVYDQLEGKPEPLRRKIAGMAKEYADTYGVEQLVSEYPPVLDFYHASLAELYYNPSTSALASLDPLVVEASAQEGIAQRKRKLRDPKTATSLPAPQPNPPLPGRLRQRDPKTTPSLPKPQEGRPVLPADPLESAIQQADTERAARVAEHVRAIQQQEPSMRKNFAQAMIRVFTEDPTWKDAYRQALRSGIISS
jgi:hypothetical protein